MRGDSGSSETSGGNAAAPLPGRRWPAVRGPRVPTKGRLSLPARAVLVVEILLAYVELLRVLRRGDLESMVVTARRTGFHAAKAPEDREHVVAMRLGWIVQRVVETLPTDKRCLINSLVLVRVLRHRSIESRLVIGVETEGGFAAHAWVEHDGRPVLPTLNFHRILDV